MSLSITNLENTYKTLCEALDKNQNNLAIRAAGYLEACLQNHGVIDPAVPNCLKGEEKKIKLFGIFPITYTESYVAVIKRKTEEFLNLNKN